MGYKAPVIRYGGKHYMKNVITPLFPEHTIYVEGFGGAGHTLLYKEPSQAEIYNDLDWEIYNFYKIVNDNVKSEMLIELLELTLYSRAEFNNARLVPVMLRGDISKYDIISIVLDTFENLGFEKPLVDFTENSDIKYVFNIDECRAALPILKEQGIEITYLEDDIERARKFYIRNRQSFNGLEKNWRSSKNSNNIRRGMAQCVSSWLSPIEEDIKLCNERLQGVFIENLDIIGLIDKYDSPITLMYLDPPYVHDSRVSKNAYDFEISDEKHIEMLNRLEHVESKVMISGYDNGIYEKILVQRFGWNKYSLGKFIKRSSNTSSGEQSEGEEIIWTNYDTETGLRL